MYVVPLHGPHMAPLCLDAGSAGMALGEAAQGSQPGRAQPSCMCGVGNGELVPWFQYFGKIGKCSKNLETMYTAAYSDCANAVYTEDFEDFKCSSVPFLSYFGPHMKP